MPDISKINNVAVADISKLDSITFAHGQKVNNQDVSLVTGAHTLIATATASSSSTLSFTSGIDSTYDVYEFHFVNMHGQTDDKSFGFQVDTGSDTDYDQPMTTTFFQAFFNEDGSGEGLAYSTGNDQATSGDGNGVLSKILKDQGADADQSGSGILTLYAPSSTTYVKHFTTDAQMSQSSNYSQRVLTAGYINITAAITSIQFKFDSGNIDAGEIKMYGIAKS